MSDNVNIGLGLDFAPKYVLAYNRTGATLTKGQVAMLDLADTQAEVTGTAPHRGNELGALASTTPVTQALMEVGFPILVATTSIADNAIGKFCWWGEIEVMVVPDDTSTTNVAKGDSVSMLVSESAVAVQGWKTGAGAGNRSLGIALEASPTGTTYATKWVLWTGGQVGYGASDT